MPAIERLPYDLENDTPEWVDTLYDKKLEEGFIPRAVVICPDQPRLRIVRTYEPDVYDYDSVQLSYPSSQDAHYAAEFSRLVVRLAKERGANYVNFLPLPSSVNVVDETYPRRMHRLVMMRLLPTEKWHLENALSNGPKSVGEAVASQD
jgi:hypothetical protein